LEGPGLFEPLTEQSDLRVGAPNRQLARWPHDDGLHRITLPFSKRGDRTRRDDPISIYQYIGTSTDRESTRRLSRSVSRIMAPRCPHPEDDPSGGTRART